MIEMEQEFVKRMMGVPRAGLAWASEVFKAARRDGCAEKDLLAAVACVAAGGADRSAWLSDDWLALKNARCSALRTPAAAERLARLLPGWLASEEAFAAKYRAAGFKGWVDSMCSLAEDGPGSPGAQAAEDLGLAAVSSPAFQAWLDGLSAEQIQELFADSARHPSKSPESWLMHLAGRLDAPASDQMLRRSCLESAKGGGWSLSGVGAGVGKLLAAKALSDPAVARGLLLELHFGPWASRSATGRFDAMEGIFSALAENPWPALAAPDGAAPEKMFSSSAPALSLAMELMCSRRYAAGLAAARWAAAQGVAGREPKNLRQAGARERLFSMSIRIGRLKPNGFGHDPSLPVKSLQEVACALRDAPLAKALASLGFSTPGPKAAKDLAARVAGVFATRVGSRGDAIPLWEGAGSAEDAEAGTIAFCEALLLEAALAPAPSSAKRSARI